MAHSRTHPSLLSLLAPLQDWPASWAGFDKDVPVGESLLPYAQAFIAELHQQGFAASTLRRHISHTWVIGGEIIRMLHDSPRLRKSPPLNLWLNAVNLGSAPLCTHASSAEQAALDATAKKLFRFLAAHP